ncbi:unnamed protein product [Adineta steineri]|uniref:Uncharacterized protein n=1 Tax=Adineta steineri TaxID=433720 RepID=A0A814QM56_9BILA|nr:unnamed protein product [Adineta steineri]
MSTNETLKKKQSADNQIASEEYEYVTIPPDGGYGWVIAISAMYSSFALFFSSTTVPNEINMSPNETLKKKQTEDNQIASEEYEYVTIPPDGGYGWVIAISAMVFLF